MTRTLFRDLHVQLEGWMVGWKWSGDKSPANTSSHAKIRRKMMSQVGIGMIQRLLGIKKGREEEEEGKRYESDSRE